MIRGDGFAVVEPGEGIAALLHDGSGSMRITVDASSGCRNLVQRVIEFRERTEVPAAPGSEEVGYVTEGNGRLTAGEVSLALAPGTGFLIPPGTAFALEPEGASMMVVSVVCPPPGSPATTDAAAPAACRVVREADREPLPAGERRSFKVLVDPSVGCRGVTQFVAFIEHSRAPEHVHAYEEVIHILDGSGTLHAADARIPFRGGTSVFLAPGTAHCLENGAAGTLRLLGAFSPPGSPADKREEWPKGGVT